MVSPTTQTSPKIYARVAGIAFLLYIVADITSMALTGPSHVADVFSLLGTFSALVLAMAASGVQAAVFSFTYNDTVLSSSIGGISAGNPVSN